MPAALLPFPTVLASASTAERWCDSRHGEGSLRPSARMHKERDQQDDRQRNADKPEQCAFHESHAIPPFDAHDSITVYFAASSLRAAAAPLPTLSMARWRSSLETFR